MDKLNITSLNCHGFNTSKIAFINKCLQTCNVLFLQEHWLSLAQLTQLGDINSDFISTAVCGFKNEKVLCGRPYGGCAILWSRCLDVAIQNIPCDSNRIVAITMSFNDTKLLFINIYMPYECSNDDSILDEFVLQLSVIANIIDRHQDALVVIGGDFNVDFSRSTIHTRLLSEFLEVHGLVSCHTLGGYEVDYTYNFDSKRFNILDHFMVSMSLAYSHGLTVSVLHDIDNISDHEPITLHLPLKVNQIVSSPSFNKKKPAWCKCNAQQLADYKDTLSSLLKCVKVPVSSLLCSNVLCDDVEHSRCLNEYSKYIIECCITAAERCIPMTGNKEVTRIPGWSEYVQPFRDTALFWHHLWVENGRPREGIIANIRRTTRCHYHRAIRQNRKESQEIINERLATSILNNRSRDFWQEIKKIRGHGRSVPNIVDNITNPEDIANVFANVYKSVFSSASTSHDQLNEIRCVIDNMLVKSDLYDQVISCMEVTKAVQMLKSGKWNDDHSISTDFFINAPDELFVHLTMLINGIISHGSVIDELRVSCIIPIPKCRNNVCDSSKYRGITLSSIIGKIIDHILMYKYQDLLITCNLQFGFKQNHSTIMCTSLLKETVAYYTSHQSSVFCVFLDATKAFDRVNSSRSINRSRWVMGPTVNSCRRTARGAIALRCSCTRTLLKQIPRHNYGTLYAA